MSKVGRNDPCPCGSGKKYKKCCMDKEETLKIKEDAKWIADDFNRYFDSFWSPEQVDCMTTEEIIQELNGMGIPFDEKAFLADTEKFYSVEAISESWFERFRPAVKGRDEDFPFFAAYVLWERLAPAHRMSMEKMNDLIDIGINHFREKDPVTGCDIWLRVWEGLKRRIKPEFKNMDPLDDQYKSSFYVSNFCQDLENELYNAGVKDNSYYQKRIDYCREFCSYFPKERELILHNMKRAIADSFVSLGDYEQSDRECANLVAEYPKNPWGYIEWGDHYSWGPQKDYARAREYYEKAEAIAKNNADDDLMVVEERLEDLNSREL